MSDASEMEIGLDTRREQAEAPAGGGDAPEHDPSELYFNRELTWLDFNERVLELGEDAHERLLERLKFLAIYTGNLDEFFMVRVAGLHDQVEARIQARHPDGLAPSEAIDRISARVSELGVRQGHLFERVLRPALAEHGIRVLACEGCSAEELRVADRLFSENIFPVLTPLSVGPGRPFPYISNLSLSLAVWLRDPAQGEETFARVKVPKEVLPRFVAIGDDTFIALEDLIARHLDRLFPGMEIVHSDYFRVARDADFTVSDEADDLVRAVEDELRRRRFGEVVRLEVGASMDPDLRALLVESLEVEERQVYDVEGPLDLGDLWELHGIEGHDELRMPPAAPVSRAPFVTEGGESADLLSAIRSGDVLVHHPYESFSSSVERFVAQAVDDPDVLAIKMTLYRTSGDSPFVPSLVEAAENGKQAVCLLELKARFDERRNIVWARALEEAGAHVGHGRPALKTHMKAVLVVRREGDGVRRYVHIGTGNYHGQTARIYEDFGLFTTDPDITADVADVFNALTGAAREPTYRKLLVAPDHMRDRLLAQIERTVEAHREGHETRIAMKMNALVDERCIEALYDASRAGVRVDLNVRGICCLRPGVAGVSDNIKVVSVVGRFLEHSRIYSFHRGSDHCYFIGSADMMPRNLDDRVELLAPVEDERLQGELEDTLERCFADDTYAWDLGEDGRWRRRGGRTRSVHAELLERSAEHLTSAVEG